MAATVSGFSYKPVVIGGLVSSADYSSANNYLAMKVTSSDEQLVTAGAGEEAIGVRLNKPNTGEAVQLAIGGIVPIKLGNTVTIGQKIKSDASGQGVAATTDKDYMLGICLRGGVSGDIIPMLWQPGFIGV